MTTNVLWPSQAEEESLGLWDSVLSRTRAQLLGKRVGGNLHSSGGMKPPVNWLKVTLEIGGKGVV